MRRLVLGASAVLATAIGSAAVADTLDDIMERGTIVVGLDPTFAPYEFTTDDGAITGYDPSLLEAIAEDMGVDVEYRVMAFSGIIPGLIAGSFDFTATALNVTAERAERISYTMPVSQTVNGVLRRVGDERVNGDDPASLVGLTAAVKQSSTPERVVQEASAALDEDGTGTIKTLSVETTEQTVTALATGRADFLVDDMSVLTAVMAGRPDLFEVAGSLGATDYIAWGVRQDDTALLEAINAGLAGLKEDGTMAALQEEFLGLTFELPETDFIPAAE
ncbi:transporter substrate-binding domain-containing protein [Palleronia sp. LCG004]|uniref:transporter substrate-binding domain-containing protein n=1 Tax=Palleronia sp. LCG004 TaxID=3079304 RepID=UPI002943E089|nr:transporter substrate-binding domain-containing protein [Palleronia sp. LCG004]WOI57898.1 transporter substrate-binding domain-containing protein [Palleronia sp. LCG004]